ncbi:sialic acid-binding Ig-like lectin 12 [Mustelus asterias]
MQFLLKLLFILQTGVQGVLNIGEVTQPSLVSVLRGQPVTITCTFIYNGTSRQWIHANWHRNSRRASNYSYSSNKPTCIPDVTLGHLNHCVSSLKLENVSSDQSDYNYLCVVKIPLYPPIERSGPGTRIQSYGPPEISTGDGALVIGHKSNLTCSAKGLYFENITFIWTCHGENIIKNITTQTSRAIVSGTPVASSQLEITPKLTDHGTVCTCQINHVTFSQPLTNEIKLHIMYGPQDPTIMYRLASSDNYRHQTNSSITVPMDSVLELKCCVDSNPISTVIWMKDSENYTEISRLESGLNCSNVKIHFQSIHGGVYWCVANNSYGWRNASVRIVGVKGKRATVPFIGKAFEGTSNINEE